MPMVPGAAVKLELPPVKPPAQPATNVPSAAAATTLTGRPPAPPAPAAAPAPAAPPAPEAPATPPAPGSGPTGSFAPTSNEALRPRTPASLSLPGVPAAGTAQALEGTTAGYAHSFGARSYVKDGANAKLVELVRAAVAKSPELAGSDLAAAAAVGNVGPKAMRALQRHLEAKGYSVGHTGIDGKYGPLTHQAMSDFLAGKPPAATGGNQPSSAPAQTAPRTEDEPAGAGRRVEGTPTSYHISQYPGATNTRETTRRNGNCGPTSTLMALKAFGYVDPTPAQVNGAIEQIRARGGATREERIGHGSGTTPDQLAKAARSYGANAQARSGQTLADVQRELAAGKKVVVLVKPGAYSPSGSRGHYVLVTGMRDGKVVVNDPAQQAGGRVIDARRFERAMRLKGGQTVAIH